MTFYFVLHQVSLYDSNFYQNGVTTYDNKKEGK